MRLPGYSLAFLLAVLLVSTTPVGTGAGAHQFDLLHPLFSHVHLMNGRVVTHDQLAASNGQLPRTTTNGPALGAASGSGAVDGGLDVSSASLMLPSVFLAPAFSDLLSEELWLPRGRQEAPPDPPPVA